SSSRHLLAEHSLSVSGQNTDYETVPGRRPRSPGGLYTSRCGCAVGVYVVVVELFRTTAGRRHG
ncbi:MAG: hypothetical protein ABS976_13715, partial [Rhodococcus sp. (in: high G+C Gram-positive bacteria)]